MTAIGGYFEIEVPIGELPYSSAVPVNFGRGGLELIIRTRRYRKIWIPDYICPVIPHFLNRINVRFDTYEVNERMEPVSIPQLVDGEAFLYVDYFGIKDSYCRKLEKEQHGLILDLTQAFYYQPTVSDGFNSARKFFGVPDGGFVFGAGMTDEGLPEAVSYDTCEALLRRADGDVAGGYAAFQAIDDSRDKNSVAKMSRLTRRLLGGVSIDAALTRRHENFRVLHAALADSNRFPVPDDAAAPLVYPYSLEGGRGLRRRLIGASVFCPAYWPAAIPSQRDARSLVENAVFLPIDQRYGIDDMNRIVSLIKEFA